ncbi:Ecr family regulatory small membrane protein, partial [Klebsiella michiganensis]
KTGNNARNGGKNSLNRLIRCVCGKKIGPDPRNFNQRVSLGRNDLLIRTFPIITSLYSLRTASEVMSKTELLLLAILLIILTAALWFIFSGQIWFLVSFLETWLYPSFVAPE